MKKLNPSRVALALVIFTAVALSLTAAQYPKQFVGRSQLAPENIAFPSVQVPSSHAINWRSSRVQYDTLAANTTYTFANSVDGETLRVYITDTASNYTVTWPGSIKWPAGSAPTQTVGAHTDEYTFTNVNGTIYGKANQNY